MPKRRCVPRTPIHGRRQAQSKATLRAACFTWPSVTIEHESFGHLVQRNQHADSHERTIPAHLLHRSSQLHLLPIARALMRARLAGADRCLGGVNLDEAMFQLQSSKHHVAGVPKSSRFLTCATGTLSSPCARSYQFYENKVCHHDMRLGWGAAPDW